MSYRKEEIPNEVKDPEKRVAAGREGGRREGEREGGREEGREEGRKGGREGGRKERNDERKEGRKSWRCSKEDTDISDMHLLMQTDLLEYY